MPGILLEENMQKVLPYIFIIFLVTIVACQKGIHWDLASAGELLKNSAVNCMPITVIGDFTAHKPITDSDFLTVNVIVAVAGAYSIASDSINGYIFKASGIFNNTGIAVVKLTCSRTPVVAETDHFNIQY